MRSIWQRKWLVVIGTLTIFFSVGAVAWAATGDEAVSGTGTRATSGAASLLTTGSEDEEATCLTPGAAWRQARQERREQRIERQEALYDALRGDMSTEDQAAYDELKATIEEERTALQEARENLAATLRELRELTDKYLGLNGDAGDD
jgi:hypothetical protein